MGPRPFTTWRWYDYDIVHLMYIFFFSHSFTHHHHQRENGYQDDDDDVSRRWWLWWWRKKETNTDTLLLLHLLEMKWIRRSGLLIFFLVFVYEKNSQTDRSTFTLLFPSFFILSRVGVFMLCKRKTGKTSLLFPCSVFSPCMGMYDAQIEFTREKREKQERKKRFTTGKFLFILYCSWMNEWRKEEKC